MCRASVAITGAGVPFGATIPNHVANSYSGKPASADGGSRGTALSRFDCATAPTLAGPAWADVGSRETSLTRCDCAAARPLAVPASAGPRPAPQPANVS